MKILYIVPNLKKKGPIEVLYSIVTNIKDYNINILQIENNSQAESNKERFENIENVTVHTLLPKGLKKGFFSVKSKIRKFVNNLSPDVIHSHCLLPDILTSLFLKKYPILTTCHNNPFEDYPKKANYLISELMIFFQFHSFKKMDVIVTISKYIDDVISENVTVNKKKLIYNGISETNFFPIEDKKILDEIKGSYNLPEGKNIIISLSSLIERKNVELLADAFLQLDLKNTILLFVGEGVLKERIANKAKHNGNVFFLGHQQKINELLNISDVLVSLSAAEGLPLSIAEANSVGVPILLSNIQPHLEYFEDYQLRDNRIHFVNLKANDVAKEVMFGLKSIQNKFETSKVNKLQDKFKSSYMTKKYLDLYKSMTNGK